MTKEQHCLSVWPRHAASNYEPTTWMTTVWTAGHSTRSSEAFLELLEEARIELVVDVRRFPMSRRNPHFNAPALAKTLRTAGISYRHAPDLGGRREPEAASVNTGLRDPGFRGFADYMASEEFDAALDRLIEEAAARRTVIVCAEAVPWRCHRSLVSDALVARGVRVVHLLGGGSREHTLTSSARLEDGRISYPGLL